MKTLVFFPGEAGRAGTIGTKETKTDTKSNGDVQAPQKVVLAGLSAPNLPLSQRSTDASMEELAALVETAGGYAVGQISQQRESPDARTFLSAGKVAELKAFAEANGCTLAVVDNELNPSQARALEEELGMQVIDRTGLILDIFAQRAQTREGQLQVELAQYKYLLPRLTGMWTHLVRQTAGGGKSPIGTRGPGETQLETDRRHIRRKIQKLEQDLAEVRKARDTQRRLRQKNDVPVVCLIGYTNAGKSTLLNCMTGADISAKNRLFDTLDTTTRRLRISATKEVLLSDTVGFIRNLPTNLVEAFKATLEELRYADVLLEVIDISNPLWREQEEVVEDLVRQLAVENKPRLRVFNKCDRYLGRLPHGEEDVCVSAKTGEGTELLRTRLAKILDGDKREVELRIPYAQTRFLDPLRKDAEIREIRYETDGIRCRAAIPADKLRSYLPFLLAEGEKEDREK